MVLICVEVARDGLHNPGGWWALFGVTLAGLLIYLVSFVFGCVNITSFLVRQKRYQAPMLSMLYVFGQLTVLVRII